MVALNCKLDWFSFTFPCGQLWKIDNEYLLAHVLLAFHDFTSHRLLGIVTNGLWEFIQPHSFYPYAIRCPKTGLQISFGGTSAYALVSLSGQSCDTILRSISVHYLALCASGRATRIDLATDMETDVLPADFAEKRASVRFRTQGTFTSETGETVYIGSRQSERFCRVYRYSPPHPRHKYLRVEIECKGAFAKEVCSQLLSASLTNVTLSVNLPYEWSHSIWDTGNADVSKIPARAYDGDGANTLRWLSSTVVPAIKKAEQKGLIDLRLWLNEHFDIEIPE